MPKLNIMAKFLESPSGGGTDCNSTCKLESDSSENEWVYAMRRQMQEILPGLFLGPYAAAKRSNLQNLLNTSISHIVCVRQDIEAGFVKPNFPEYFTYLVLNIADTLTENILCHFENVNRFIDDSLQKGGKVLVHGNAGISRSAAFVIAYIMEKYGVAYREAFQYVQDRRFCVQPNDGFVQQLKEFEPIYKARQTQRKGQSSKETGFLKRKFQEDETEDPMDS